LLKAPISSVDNTTKGKLLQHPAHFTHISLVIGLPINHHSQAISNKQLKTKAGRYSIINY
jgi:hypothetical protein